MQRLFPYLLGPEMIWLAFFVFIKVMIRLYAPGKLMDNLAENLYLIVPLLALLIFSLWYFPGVEKNWLLPRVWVAGVLGAHYVLDKGLAAYSVQGPGIGTTYIVGMLLVFFALIVGSVFVWLRF